MDYALIGSRSVLAKKPVKTPEDLAGMPGTSPGMTISSICMCYRSPTADPPT